MAGDHDDAAVGGAALHADRLDRGARRWPGGAGCRAAVAPARPGAGSAGCAAAPGCRGRRTSGSGIDADADRRPARISAARTRSGGPAHRAGPADGPLDLDGLAVLERGQGRGRQGRRLGGCGGQVSDAQVGADGLDPGAGDAQVDQVAVGPDRATVPAPVPGPARTAAGTPSCSPTAARPGRTRPRPGLPPGGRPDGPRLWTGCWTGSPGANDRGLGRGAAVLRVAQSATAARDAGSHTAAPRARSDRGEPVGRGHRLLGVEGLVRPVGVVARHPRVDRRLRLLERGRTGPPRRGTRGGTCRGTAPPSRSGSVTPGAVSRCVIPLLAADLVEQHLTRAAVPLNRSVNCLPLSVITSSGTPNRASACANARHTARPVARSTTFAITQNREWSSTPVTSFASRSTPVAGSTSGSRRRCRSATTASAPAVRTAYTSSRGRFRGRARTRPCRSRIRSIVAVDGTATRRTCRMPAGPRSISSRIRTRSPPRMLPAHLDHRAPRPPPAPDAGTTAAGATGPPTRRPPRPDTGPSTRCTVCRDTPTWPRPRSPSRPPTPPEPRPDRCSTTDKTTSANPGLLESDGPTEHPNQRWPTTAKCQTSADTRLSSITRDRTDSFSELA